MTWILAFATVAGIFLAGCASVPEADKTASVECKIQPYQTATITDGKKREVSPLERRYAEMQLASSDYRMKQLRSGLGQTGAIEEVLRDCNR